MQNYLSMIERKNAGHGGYHGAYSGGMQGVDMVKPGRNAVRQINKIQTNQERIALEQEDDDLPNFNSSSGNSTPQDNDQPIRSTEGQKHQSTDSENKTKENIKVLPMTDFFHDFEND